MKYSYQFLMDKTTVQWYIGEILVDEFLILRMLGRGIIIV